MAKALKRLLEPKESDIERLLLDYLHRLRGGFVMKVNMGGKPIRRGNNIVMAPFSSPYAYRGVSDIQFIWFGMVHALEVKTPAEHKYLIKHRKTLLFQNPDLVKNKKKKHLIEQMQYIERVRKAGGVGEFVSSLTQLKTILEKSKKNLVQLGLVK